MHNYIVQIAFRFIQQLKEPDSASCSPMVITGAYIPEKLCKNKQIYIKKSYNFKVKFKFYDFFG